MERMLVAFSIATVAFAISYAGSMAVTTSKPPPAPVVARPLDAPALVKKLDKLDLRLREAQQRIDEVLLELANTREDSQRDAARVRLDVLYRLEDGLTADIAHAREALARVTAR